MKKQLLLRLWNDEAGLVLSAELVFMSSIVVIGMIVGLSAARDGVTSELSDVGSAISEYNQSYLVNGITGHGASIAGTHHADSTDYCDVADDTAATDEGCIVRVVATGNDEEDSAPEGSIVP